MPHIAVELVWDILSRLPVEPLLRFRSACKTWCQIIDDPAFIKSHLRLQQNNEHHHLIFKTSPTSFRMFPLTYLYYSYSPSVTETPKTIQIQPSAATGIPVASCDGLILMIKSPPILDMALWNPSTRERLELPRLETTAFGFEKSCTWRIPRTGIGYDEANDDYKVVLIKSVKLPEDSIWDPRTFVYSLNSRTWSMISEEYDYAKCYVPRDEGVLLKGELHWIGTHLTCYREQEVMLSFDISKNSYRIVSLPEVFGSLYPRLYVFDECLFVMGSSKRKVYKMESSCGSWSEVFSIKIPFIAMIDDDLTPISYLKSKQQVLFANINRKSMKIDEFIWFDIHGKAPKRVTTSDDDLPADGYAALVTQTSLVRLNPSAHK